MTESLLTNIWKYCPTTGYWKLVRDCYKDRKDDWLRIFRGDEPDAHFKASKRRPTTPPKGARI